MLFLPEGKTGRGRGVLDRWVLSHRSQSIYLWLTKRHWERFFS